MNERSSRARKGLLHGKLPICATLDTNVLLDTGSVHDLWNEYETLAGQPIHPTTDSPNGPMRRQRARDGLLLLEYLHQNRLATYSPVGAEFERLMTARVPPTDQEFPTHYARAFAHHVIERMFPGWTGYMDRTDTNRVGNACDRHLVQKAGVHGVPVITNEARPNGAIRRAADAAGVRVMTPREFWERRADEGDLIDSFIERWNAGRAELHRRLIPKFVRPAQARTMVERMTGYIHHVLLDERMPSAPRPVAP